METYQDMDFDLLDFMGTENREDDTERLINSFISSELKIPLEVLNYGSNSLNSTSPLTQSSSDASIKEFDLSKLDNYCPVCHGEAGKHSSYGGERVCVSCRGFFRRSVQSHQYQVFECIDNRGQACQINSKSRKSCKFCRFQKCLQSGMKISWVWSDSERNARLVKISMNKKLLRNQQLPKHIEFVFSTEEKDLCRHKLLVWTNQISEKFYNHFSENIDMFQQFLDITFSGRKIPDSMLEALEEIDEQQFTNFIFNQMEEMSTFSAYDKMKLISQNYCLIFGLLLSLFGTSDSLNDWLVYLHQLGTSSDVGSSRSESLAKAIEPYLVEKPQGRTCLVQWYFEPQSKDSIDAANLLEVVEKIKPWLRNKDDNFDIVACSLIFLICIFNPGSLKLEQRKEIQEFHDKHVWKLHRYLKDKYGSKAARYLHNILMVLTHAEKVYNICKSSKLQIKSS